MSDQRYARPFGRKSHEEEKKKNGSDGGESGEKSFHDIDRRKFGSSGLAGASYHFIPGRTILGL